MRSCRGVFFLVSAALIGSFDCVAILRVALGRNSPMVWPGVESGVTDPSGDGWNGCWTLVRIILGK